MLIIILIVLFSGNIVESGINDQYVVKFDIEILNKLRISSDQLSGLIPYDEFELSNYYLCGMECIKDKNTCTGYTFDSTTDTCSLFHDSNKLIDDDDLTNLRKKFKKDVCDDIKCKPDAVCIGEDKPKCVCLNGESTSDECDKIETGIWTDFNDWSACSVTCGEGFQYRKRECLSANDKTKKISHEICIGKDMEIQPCEVTTCPVYGPWSAWTPCSKLCGIGVKQRNRSCIPPGSNCGNYTFEQRACGEANCQRVVGIKETEPEIYPMKGYLAIREGDIICVKKSSNGTIKHMADLICKSIGFDRGAQYAVLNPTRYNSTCYPGIVCDGTETNFHNCKYDRTQISTNTSDLFAIVTRCIVDGGFSAWSSWSTCSKTCNTGQSIRTRTCTEPAPSIPEPETISTDSLLTGMNCTGDYIQTKTCNEQIC